MIPRRSQQARLVSLRLVDRREGVILLLPLLNHLLLLFLDELNSRSSPLWVNFVYDLRLESFLHNQILKRWEHKRLGSEVKDHGHKTDHYCPAESQPELPVREHNLYKATGQGCLLYDIVCKNLERTEEEDRH